MFITKKHIARRTVLKAAGVKLALPFLEAMVPAATALAQTAAAPKMRAAFFYLPHGAIMYNTSHGPAMDKWTPSGSGADFKLSPILASLEPYKKYVTSFGNLENAATAGSVHTFNPATWLSATRPDTGGPKRAHGHDSRSGDREVSSARKRRCLLWNSPPKPPFKWRRAAAALIQRCRSATRNRRCRWSTIREKSF